MPVASAEAQAAFGDGGVYVGAAPDLLFIPDKDGDDKPDGPPDVGHGGSSAPRVHAAAG